MGTKQLLIIGAVVVILGGAALFALSGPNTSEDTMIGDNNTAMMKETNGGMMQTNEAAMMEETGGAMRSEEDAMMDKAESMMKAGSYEAYSAEKVSGAGTGKVLLFFYADWCPLCRPLDADINAHLSDIPSDVLILKVNYDKETALKQRYGVTYQHTIVEVNSEGSLIKKWAVINPTFSELISEIK
jgi:thioredoxin 1